MSAVLGHVLRTIPLAVLFGIFLYMGLSSTAGIQLFERIQLFFMPAKHHPMVGYVRQVRSHGQGMSMSSRQGFMCIVNFVDVTFFIVSIIFTDLLVLMRIIKI